MAQDMEQVVRNGLAAWSRGDLEATLHNMAPDLEFITAGVYPGLDPVYRGHEGFRRFWTDFRDTWSDVAIEIDRVVMPDESTVAVTCRFLAKGRDGIEVERSAGMVHTLRDGLLHRIRNYGSPEEAMQAVGAPA